MTRVLRPAFAPTAARLHVMVDLPTPPFWLNTTRRMGELLLEFETAILQCDMTAS
jgi:hypothetical protein